MLSQIYTPGWSSNDGNAVPPHIADIPPVFKFHGLPVYWLLPGGHQTNTIVPTSVFHHVEGAPADTPRIFLSHMPVEHFEYDPAPGTKIFYLLREPRAVWGKPCTAVEPGRHRCCCSCCSCCCFCAALLCCSVPWGRHCCCAGTASVCTVHRCELSALRCAVLRSVLAQVHVPAARGVQQYCLQCACARTCEHTNFAHFPMSLVLQCCSFVFVASWLSCSRPPSTLHPHTFTHKHICTRVRVRAHHNVFAPGYPRSVPHKQQPFSLPEVAQIARDFVDGNLPLPPRFRERGPEFAWNAHALGWWQRLGGAANGAVVDFDVAMADPIRAVEQLQRYCGNNTARPAGYDARAEAIASRASRESASRGVASSSSYPNTAAQAEYHFPSATFVVPGSSLGADDLGDFVTLPAAIQELFNRSTLAWDVVRRAALFLPVGTLAATTNVLEYRDRFPTEQ